MATIGTTSTSSIDPVPAIADACERAGVWLHVDAAYAGSAAVCPELRDAFAGWERADSIVVNPHKWLLTPMDCSTLWTRRPDDLRAAFSLVPEYLRVSEEVASLSEYSPVLGRRFRALKLWAVLRCYGREGLQERIREAIRLAALFEGWVREEPGWELAAPRPFSLVCFRRDGSDEENEALLERVNASGEVFISHTKLNGRYVLRLAVGNARTTEDGRARLAWEVLRREAGGVGEKPSMSRSRRLGIAFDPHAVELVVDDELVRPGRVGLDERLVAVGDPLDRGTVDERRLLATDAERDRVAAAERRQREVECVDEPALLERVGRRRPQRAGAPARELVQHRPQVLSAGVSS